MKISWIWQMASIFFSPRKKIDFFFQKILYEENGKHSRHVCTFFSILARGLSFKGKQKGYRICPRDKKALEVRRTQV